MILQTDIDNLSKPGPILSLIQYHQLLERCVQGHEFAATVYVYDHLLAKGLKPEKETFQIIERLHSKTLPEKNTIYLKPDGKKKLQPRRRIHKIIKGYHYSDNYNAAKVYIPKVKAFLAINLKYKQEPRIKLAKIISRGCHISFNDARFIITSLKREGYLPKDDAKTSSQGLDKFKFTKINTNTEKSTLFDGINKTEGNAGTKSETNTDNKSETNTDNKSETNTDNKSETNTKKTIPKTIPKTIHKPLPHATKSLDNFFTVTPKNTTKV